MPYKDEQKRKEKRKEYYRKNRDKAISYSRKWKQENRDRVNETSRKNEKKKYREDEEYRRKRNAFCKKYYILNREKRIALSRKHRGTIKERARYDIRNAVRSGKITKPNKCEFCGRAEKLHGHHPDYSKPLEVIWLCCLCHMSIHKSFSSF